MENENFTEIGQLGEFGLIDRLTKDINLRHKTSLKGVGDDAAVIEAGDHVKVVTTDLLVEGIHFDMMYTPLKHLGYKSIVVNLSDVYAMNAEPQQVTVSLAISNRFSVEAIDELYSGIYAACDRYGVDLVGGDTTSSTSGLIISVTAIGAAVKENIVYRNGAGEGDWIAVSGDLGAAYLGLQILEREKQIYLDNPEIQPDIKDHEYIVGRQLKPEARADVWRYLKEMKVHPTSMIDISDGLSSELMHICQQSNTGCQIEEELVPISKDTFDLAIKFSITPVTCALSGGEDYELLFTVKDEDKQHISNSPFVTIIGQMKKQEEGLTLLTKGGNVHELTSLGWDSFGDEANGSEE